MTRCAVAIFVKTPGLSPIKTRLAATAGAETAREFYRQALSITEVVVARAVLEHSDLVPYWAVAERDAPANSLWQRFATVWQGEGGLGTRLDRVYAELRREYPAVLLIGADSPLLTPGHLCRAAEAIAGGGSEFVLGRALDGGFYLFGGRAPVPREAWEAVGYSAGDTAEQLLRQLRPIGGIAELSPLPDVDTLDDLRGLAEAAEEELLPSQRALLAWVREMGVR